ncbi:carboxylesterase family protein [Streptomyces sp. NPDC001698]|uniref:carboxylesterase family protein n=1 Tax=Streptomyces sp. NPDC001698 TaxID=3364601 RepID=UPI0036BD6138
MFRSQVPGVDMANAHSAELAYLHDVTMRGRPLTAEQTTLSNDMKRRWAAFARTGVPDVPGETQWPRIGARYTSSGYASPATCTGVCARCGPLHGARVGSAQSAGEAAGSRN